MRIVATFDPSTETNDTFNAGFTNGVGKMIVYNESNINLQLSWGAFTTYCPAWTAMLYCVSTNNVNITWGQQSTLATVGSPLSQVLVEVYDPGEPVIGTFPAALVRQTNIGNNTPLSTSATSVSNDGNIANTRFIEATVSGDASSAVSLKNDGTLALGNATHKGSISSDNAAFTTDGNGNLTTKQVTATNQFPGFRISSNNADFRVAGSGVNPDGVLRYDGGDNWFIIPLTGRAVKFQESGGTTFFACDATGLSVIGHIDITTNNTTLRMKDTGGTLRDVLYVDAANGTDIQAAALNGAVNVKNQNGTNYLVLGSGTLGISAAGDILDASSATQTYLKARTSGSINFQTPNGTTRASVDATGINLLSGSLSLLAGGVARMGKGHTASLSGVTITHGLGATPDMVQITTDIAQPGSSTTGVGSVGATTFVATSAAGSGFYWLAMQG